MQSSWNFASKPDWRLNIWSGDQKWRNGNKHRKYLKKYLQRKYLETYLHKKYLKIYLHKKLDYFCNLTLSMALYKSLAFSWTGIITSQPNPIIRKSEIWFHQKKRIIIAGKPIPEEIHLSYKDTLSKCFENTGQLQLSYSCQNSFISRMPGGTCLWKKRWKYLWVQHFS